MATLGIKIKWVTEVNKPSTTYVAEANEPIAVLNASGQRIGVCFGDGAAQLKDLPVIGQGTASSGQGVVRTFTSTLLFDIIEGVDYGSHPQAAAINFTLAGSGNKILAGNRATIVSDGVNPINFDGNFDFLYGIANGEVLAAGSYEFYFLYKGNGKVTVNVPGGTTTGTGTGSGSTAPTAPQGVTVSNVQDTTATVSWTASTDN